MGFRRKWFSRKLVHSDGYFIEPLDAATVVYGDAVGRVYLECELQKNGEWTFSTRKMRMDNEYGRLLLDETRKNMIVARTKAAFAHMKIALTVDPE